MYDAAPIAGIVGLSRRDFGVAGGAGLPASAAPAPVVTFAAAIGSGA